jgi:hypothetical protein
MLATLGAARALVCNSEREGWPDEEPAEVATTLDQMMAHVIDPDRVACPQVASIQFLPTGPLQEIAISNGWHDAYMALAEEFDHLQQALSLFRS